MAGGQTPPPPLSSHGEGENTYTNPLNPQHPRQPHDKVSTKQWNLPYDSNNPSASLMPAGVCSLTPPQEDEHHTVITNHPIKPSIGKQTNQIPLTEKSSAQTNGIFIGSHMVPFNQCFTPEVWDTRSSVVGLKLSHFASTSTRYQHISQDKPKVVFHKSDKAKLISGLKNTLIAKFSHGQPSVLMLRTFLSNRKLIGKFHVSFFDAKHIFIEFEHFVDFAKFWIKQKGIINGFPVRFFKWDELFDPSKESSIVPVWIHLPRLPFYLFEEGAILLIASALGRPLHIDANNLNRNKIGYATVCIELDILKVHPSDIWIQFGECTSDGKTDGSYEGFQQQIVYGFMPPFCSSCSHIGHQSVTCKRYSVGNDMKPALGQNMNIQVEGTLLHSRSVLAADESKIQNRAELNKVDVSLSEAMEVIEEGELDGKLEPALYSAIRHAVSSSSTSTKFATTIEEHAFAKEPDTLSVNQPAAEMMKENCCCRDGVHALECLNTAVGNSSISCAAGAGTSVGPGNGENAVNTTTAESARDIGEASATPDIAPAAATLAQPATDYAAVSGSAQASAADLFAGHTNTVQNTNVVHESKAEVSRIQGPGVTTVFPGVRTGAEHERITETAGAGKSLGKGAADNLIMQGVLGEGFDIRQNKSIYEGHGILDNGGDVSREKGIKQVDNMLAIMSGVQSAAVMVKQKEEEHTTSITPQKLSSAAAEFTPKWAVLVEELVEGKKQSDPVLDEKEGEESLQDKSANAGGQVVMVTNYAMDQLNERMRRLRGEPATPILTPILDTSTWVPPSMSKHLARELKKNRKQYRINQNWQDIEDYSDEVSEEGELDERVGSQMLNGEAFLSDGMGDIPRPFKIKSAPNSPKGKNSSYDSSTYLLSRKYS